MNLSRELKNWNGTAVKMSFPSNEEEQQKNETVRNVLLNVLSVYPIRQKKEVFVINRIAQIILGKDTFDPTDEEKKVIVAALEEATHRKNEKGETQGIYLTNTIAQIYEEMGITE